MNIPLRLRTIVWFFALLTFASLGFAANVVWTGTGGSDNWSDAGNWTGGAPAGNSILFWDEDATGGGAYGAANNIVDASISVATLKYGNTNGNHNTFIPAGVTLTVESSVGTALSVGTGTDNKGAQLVYASVQGAGSLLVTNTSGIISIIQGSATAGSKNATLDLENLDNFAAYVSQIRVAAENGGSSTPQFNRPNASLILAKTNLIYATGNPGLRVSWTSGNGGPGLVRLGATNAILANYGIAIGDRKATGARMEFNPMFSYPIPLALFRDQAGTGRQSQWAIGDQVLQTGGATSAEGTIDLSLGIVDAMVGTLIVGRGAGTGGTGVGTGTLTLGAGVIDANDVNIGVRSAAEGKGTVDVTASYLAGPGTLKVNNTMRLTTGALSEATLNVTGGNVYANNIESGGGAVANITLTGATLAVTNAAGTLASPILNLNAGDSTILLPVREEGVNLFVTFLTVTSTTNNTIGITALPPITAYPYQASLVSYLGYAPVSGADFVARFPGLSPTYTGYISNNVFQSTLDLVVTGGPPPARNLVWSGNANGNWDEVTTNWTHGAAATTFRNGDAVEFNNLGLTTTINLVGAVSATDVIVVDSAQAYTFTGAGQLMGGASLLKTGAGTLTLSNTGENSFAGGASVSNGVLRVSGKDNRMPTNCVLTLGDTSGIRFEMAGVSQELGGLTGGAAGVALALGSSTLTINAGGGAYYGVIEGTGSLVKSGTGSQTLAGPSTYSGGTHVTGGGLVIANTSGSGTGAGFVQVETNATLTLGAGNASGSIAVATITNNGTIFLSRNDAFTLSTEIVGDGGMTKNNPAGQVTIATANSYKGTTTINSGVVRVSHPDALGTSDGATSIANDASAQMELLGDVTLSESIILAQKQSAAGYIPGLMNGSGTNTLNGLLTLNPGGSFWIVAAEAGKMIVNGPITNNTSSGNRVLWLSGEATGEWNSGLPNGTATSNTGLRKDGAGTWSLAGVFNYPGPTVLSNGTLLVNGQIQGGSVQAYGGTLGGTGTISVPVTVYPEATLAPGLSIGKLSVNNDLWLQGRTIMEVSGSGHDQVAVSGTLTNGGILTVVLAGAVQGGEIFQLFTAGQFVDAFTSVEVPELPAGMAWNQDALNTAGVLSIAGGAPKISITRAGDDLTFSWPGTGYRLQAQTNSLAGGLTGNWQPYPGGEASPVTVTINSQNPTVFFRLVSP